MLGPVGQIKKELGHGTGITIFQKEPPDTPTQRSTSRLPSHQEVYTPTPKMAGQKVQLKGLPRSLNTFKDQKQT